MEKVVTKKEIVTILDRLRESKTVTAEGAVWEIHEKDIPKEIIIDVK